MSIEHGVTSGAPKAAAPGVAGHGHGKAQSGAAAPGGFAALLLSLGADELPVEAPLVGQTADTLTAPAGSAEQPAELLAAALPLADATLTPPLVPGVALPVVATNGPITSEPAPAAAAVTPALLSAGGEGAPGAGRKLPARADLPTAAGEPAAGAAVDGGTAAATPLVAPAAELQPLLRQVALAQRLAQQRTQGAEQAAQALKEQRGEDLAARLGWQTSERLEPVGGPPPAWLAASAEGGLRPFERRSEKSGPRHGVGEVGGWSLSAPADTNRLDVPAAAPDAGLMTEMQVAEQVSVWVSRGVQNAELELEGPGEGTVNVSISLQGQEARVEFRADQLQTRQVLEDSMPHLRELLAREGLVLSGMSVGSSGSDGAAGRQSQQQGRSGQRQAVVAVPELPAAAAAAARGALAPGRAVDLFV